MHARPSAGLYASDPCVVERVGRKVLPQKQVPCIELCLKAQLRLAEPVRSSSPVSRLLLRQSR